jgi:hypothetical protein
MDTTAATLAVDGSAEASSPEAEAFCAAVVAVDAAVNSHDEAAIGSAVEAATAAATADGGPLLEAVLTTSDAGGPEFAEAYAALIDYMKANCGYAEVNVTASEFQFEGFPSEVPAGPTILALENAGEQVHDIFVMRLSDDFALSTDEIEALDKDEVMTIGTLTAFTFTFPGTTGYATADLVPGRYVTVCLVFDGATPEVLMHLQELGVNGPDDTIPPDAGVEIGDRHFNLGMVHEFTVV